MTSAPDTLPPELVAPLEQALRGAVGSSVTLRSLAHAWGGCIHHAAALETSAGPFFLKWNDGYAGAAFTAEARGLGDLRRAASADGIVRVPDVIGAADSDPADDEDFGWLLLEYLPPSPAPPDYDERLGAGLAGLHAASRDSFGWDEPNRIGSLPQENPDLADWATFWREARLRPQLEAAFDEGGLGPEDRAWSDPLLERVEEALATGGPDGPQLIHGDLWSGNVHPGPTGEPVLVDPATYYGHGEVDLAMTQLFGGFSDATFRAYGPRPEGWTEVRRPLYQLYYLLVHVRLFGQSYYRSARAAAEQILAALG